MRFENVSSSDSHDDGLDSAISRNEWNQGLDEIAASFGMDTSMYERDGPIITYGRCSPFRGICIRHGRWEYFDHAGKSSRIEKYENGKLVEVRDQ